MKLFVVEKCVVIAYIRCIVCSIILKIMGWNQYIINRPTTLTGIHQLELRILSKMGYEVFVVNTRFYLVD